MEDVLGVPLFHRQRTGTTPTKAGQVVVASAMEIFRALEQMAQDASAVAALEEEPIAQNTGRAGRRPSPVGTR